MFRNHWKVSCVVVLLFVLGVAVAQSPDGPKGADAKAAAFNGKAVHVVLKGHIQLQARNTTFLLLDQAQIKVFGVHSFVGGRSVEHGTQVWVPLAEVAALEEFASLKEMGKVYSLPPAVEK